MDIIEEYVKEYSEKFRLDNPLKVVIDSGNGVAGLTGPQVFRNIGCQVVELYCDPDGTFPNHPADPLEKGP